MKTLFTALIIAATALGVTVQTAGAQSAEATAIKAVIERETQSWLNVDAKAWANCWADVPESRLLYSESNGKVHQINMPEGMAKMLANQKPSKATFRNTNYQIRVKGNAAFAQFDQVFSGDDGSKEYARETRYLEKADGAGGLENRPMWVLSTTSHRNSFD